MNEKVIRETAWEREALKPCPFCNAPGYLIESGETHYKIKCTSSLCYGQTVGTETKTDATAGWNRREVQPVAPEQLELMADAARWRELDALMMDPECEFSVNHGGWLFLKGLIDATEGELSAFNEKLAAAQAVSPLNAPSNSNANSNALQEHPNTLGNLTERAGYKLVPVESTLEMQVAASAHAKATEFMPSGPLWWNGVWKAMLAAASDACAFPDCDCQPDSQGDVRCRKPVAAALGSDKPEKSDSKRGLDHAAGQQPTVSGWIATHINGKVLHLSKLDGWVLDSVIYEPWSKPMGLAAPIQPTSEEQP